MKELKTYAHLYLGCECIIGDLNWKPEKYLHGLAPGVDPNHGKPIRTTLDAHVLNTYLHMITLVLRPLSDMTEEEMRQYATLRGYKKISNVELVPDGIEFTHPGLTTFISFDKNNSAQFAFLLSRGFDLFGLIDAGLAVSKTETTNDSGG